MELDVADEGVNIFTIIILKPTYDREIRDELKLATVYEVDGLKLATSGRHLSSRMYLLGQM